MKMEIGDGHGMGPRLLLTEGGFRDGPIVTPVENFTTWRFVIFEITVVELYIINCNISRVITPSDSTDDNS